MRELERARERYSERLAALESELRQLRSDRESDWRKAAEAGIPAAQIADVFGVSRQRVSAVLKSKT
jgi:hypothetical protein